MIKYTNPCVKMEQKKYNYTNLYVRMCAESDGLHLMLSLL